MKKVKKRRNKRRKINIFIPCLIIFFVLMAFLGLKLTESKTYTVYENGEEVKSYHHFPFAKLKMDTLDGDCYICDEEGKAYAISQGFVNFHTKDITQNTSYTTENGDGYLNGSYGADALYLKTNLWGTKVQFKESGDVGWVDLEDIQLFFFDDSLASSYYINKEGSLYHIIVTDMLQGNHASWPIGIAPDFMKEDIPYYSYDGHYFYTNLEDLYDEENAINKEPFYNFYQYVPHRSITHISKESLNTFLQNEQSILYDSASYFFDAQDTYSMNAAMMMSVALNESGLGFSQIAFENNNLFGHAVYDASPDSANSYASIQDCINAHASYFLNEGYANVEDDRYNGSWFGDKESGINVNYASDPYWGEKAASYYYQLDSLNDFIDYKSIELITMKPDHEIKVYEDKKKKKTLYTISMKQTVSFNVKDGNSSGNKVCYTIISDTISNQNGYIFLDKID